MSKVKLEDCITAFESLQGQLKRLREQRLRFVIAIVVVLAALVLTFSARLVLGSADAVLFALTVASSTALLGLASGLCAAGISFLVLDYFMNSPHFEFEWNAAAARYALVMIAVVALSHLVERFVSSLIRARSTVGRLNLHGFLDDFENGVVSGWALDADHPQEPITVAIFVNNCRVAEVAAVHHRPDVAEAMACSGAHGFYVDLTEQLPNTPDVQIDIHYANGSHLPNSPCWFPNSPQRELPPKTVLFMHIAKTAGTAFREAIAANFRLSEIAYLYPTPPGFLVPDLWSLSWKQLRAYKIVIGHFQYGIHSALPQASEYITIVRSPIARVVSQYAFLVENQPDLVMKKSGQLKPLQQVLESGVSVNFDNAMVRCFAGVDEAVFPSGTLTDEVYQTASHNLRTAFSFIGHQESAGEAYLALCKKFGWRAVPELAIVNRGTAKPRTGLEHRSALDAIRHYNQLDIRLYEEICTLFPPKFTREASGLVV